MNSNASRFLPRRRPGWGAGPGAPRCAGAAVGGSGFSSPRGELGVWRFGSAVWGFPSKGARKGRSAWGWGPCAARGVLCVRGAEGKLRPGVVELSFTGPGFPPLDPRPGECWFADPWVESGEEKRPACSDRSLGDRRCTEKRSF